MAIVAAVIGATVIVLGIALAVPWLSPVLDPLFKRFNRYCEWVERRQAR